MKKDDRQISTPRRIPPGRRSSPQCTSQKYVFTYLCVGRLA